MRESMKATAFEFRFRVWLMVAVIFLGFSAPWIEWLHLGTRTTAWLWLGFEAGSLGLSSTAGIQLVTALTILVAALAAFIRIWGTAYLGTATVNNAQMKAGSVMADGPYRRVRNPLYLGSFLMVAVISVLMPPSGALFTLVVLGLFLLRLILGEEAFLAPRLGESYAAYKWAVPRLIPSFRPRVPAGGQAPNWGRAILSEITPLGVLVSFAALSWQYNSFLLTRCVLISFGISIVVKALIASGPESPQAAA
jgi:protein-S-isoprenylcysteine O-methyltransferase Ste14